MISPGFLLSTCQVSGRWLVGILKDPWLLYHNYNLHLNNNLQKMYICKLYRRKITKIETHDVFFRVVSTKNNSLHWTNVGRFPVIWGSIFLHRNHQLHPFHRHMSDIMEKFEIFKRWSNQDSCKSSFLIFFSQHLTFQNHHSSLITQQLLFFPYSPNNPLKKTIHYKSSLNFPSPTLHLQGIGQTFQLILSQGPENHDFPQGTHLATPTLKAVG